MRVAVVTVGDPQRLTGGYLYNRRLLEGLRERGVGAEQVVASGASPEEQAGAANGFCDAFDPAAYDVVIVDTLSRIVCGPHLDHWRSVRPVVALVHELPGVADPAIAERERPFEGSALRSDRLVAVSEHGKEVLQGRDVPEERIFVVPPGFDRLVRGQKFERTANHAPNVLCVAQWIPRKGVLDLVRSWKLEDRTGSVLHLVGETDADAGYARDVRDAISREPSVVVHGPVDDEALADLYASADVFAVPSRYEGYGIVYAEALSFGLPVVACRVGPIPELVGDAALLVPPEDPEALSEALARLLSDAGLREKMSGAARRRAAELPSWSDTVDGFLGVLREAVEERGR